MSKEVLNKKAQKLIKDQKLECVWATEDGQLFYQEGFAKSHAASKRIACYKIAAEVAKKATPSKGNKK